MAGGSEPNKDAAREAAGEPEAQEPAVDGAAGGSEHVEAAEESDFDAMSFFILGSEPHVSQ